MNKYLVTYEIEDHIFAVIETAREIFNKMDMADCYNIRVIVLEWLCEYDCPGDYKLYGYPECEFKGTWSCRNPETNRIDPLRMEIRRVDTGEVLDVGYGTDH